MKTPENELARKLYETIRMQGKSLSTYKTYNHWVQAYSRYCGRCRPTGGWSSKEQAAESWLTYLAIKAHVSPTTQNIALQSICYLYRHVYKKPLENVAAVRSKKPITAREVCDESEIVRLFDQLSGVHLLVAQLIYGCGIRIGEVAALRIKDLSFERRQIHVHAGKGNKSRVVGFPECLHAQVQNQMQESKRLWEWDQKHNANGVSMPYAFSRKSPRAGREWRWYYLFCSGNLSQDDNGDLRRHHMHKSHLSREIKLAADRARIDKRITSHSLRHSHATHSHEYGTPIAVLQQLLGHEDASTTHGYIHVDKTKATATPSPLARVLADKNLMRGSPITQRRLG